MARLDGYFFIDTGVGFWTLPSDKGYCAVGYVSDREGFEDGDLIETTRIQKRVEDQGYIVTNSGNQYELGTMSPDYEQYVNAIRSGKIIADDWYIFLKDNGQYKFTTLAKDGRHIEGIVVGQEGNFVVLDTGLKVFVNWRKWPITGPGSYHTDFKYRLIADDRTYLSHYETVDGWLCRPILV